MPPVNPARILAPLLVAVLIIASAVVPAPARAAPLAPAFEPSRSHRTLTDEGWTPARTVHPLFDADPDQWVPILHASGSLEEAVEAAQGKTKNYYSVEPLGDADHDGTEDYLVATRQHTLADETAGDVPPDVETLQAVSGRSAATIWTRQLPQDAYWFELGDIDHDGVIDFAFDVTKSSTTASDLDAIVLYNSQHRSDVQGTLTVLGGSTGKDLLSRPWKGFFQSTVRSAGALLVDATQYSYEVDLTGIQAIGGGAQPGVELVRFTYSSETDFAYAVVLFSYYSRHAVAYSIERVDPTGKSLWTVDVSDPEHDNHFVDDRDYTGDNIPDHLFGGSPARYAYAQAVGADFAADGAVVTSTLVDGATGKVAWTYKSPPSIGYGIVAPGGRSSTGMTALAQYYGRSATSPHEFQSFLVVLDGAKGTVLQTRSFPNTLIAVAELGDVDADASSEWIMLKAPFQDLPIVGGNFPDKADLIVAKRDVSAVWTRKDVSLYELWMGPPHLEPDFDGDGIPDVTLFKQSEDGTNLGLEVLAGATGKALWSRAISAATADVNVVDDLDGAGGVELAFTVFDIPEGEMSGSTRYNWDFDSDPLNYAPYPARLELRRGSDAELIWAASVYDGSAQNDTLVFPYTRTATIADLDGDAAPDVLYTLSSAWYVSITCTNGVCTFSVIGDDEPLVSLALVMSAARGAVLRSYPELARPVPVETGRATIAANPPATPSPDTGFAPGFGLLAGVAAFAVGYALRRRHA